VAANKQITKKCLTNISENYTETSSTNYRVFIQFLATNCRNTEAVFHKI
jgi:hypothetical protein